MKTFFFSICLMTASCIFAQQPIAVEMEDVWQDCDSVHCDFVLTDSLSDGSGMVMFEIQNTGGTAIAAVIAFYDSPVSGYHGSVCTPIYNQPFGSHTCKMTAYNTGNGFGVSTVEDLDLLICTIGINEQSQNWCSITVTEGAVVLCVNNANATNVSVIDLTGKTVFQKTIFERAFLETSDLSPGIYIVQVQQGIRRTAFKFAVPR